MKIKNLSLVLLSSAFIVITSLVILKSYESETLVEAKWNEKEEPLLAISIDGKESDSFPSTSNYTGTVTCSNGNGIISWNGNKWVFNVTGISKNKARCNVAFIKILYLKDIILGDNNANVSEPSTTPGSEISSSTEAVLASTSDDYGTSYYFRGAVTNNYVEYANMCWRIVRVTGNGAIKLVLYNYNGLTSTNNTPSSSTPCNVTGNNLALARYEGDVFDSIFNSSCGDNVYVGFMYGTAGASSYAAAHSNTNPSAILTNLNKWYTNVLSKQANFNNTQLADTIWCNDKSVVTDATFNPGNYSLGTNYGYGTNINYYSSAKRLVQSSSWNPGGTGPSLICPNDNNGGKLSKFTVSDTKYGNGTLKNYAKLGLLTADELAFAGSGYNTANSTFYLKDNANSAGYGWLTLSPASYYGGIASFWSVNGYTLDLESISTCGTRLDGSSGGVRPALSLISTTKISSGTGTATDPYKVTF